MVDLAFVLADLRSQFSGQSVLYAADIAKVLSKSEKAIAHLIARKNLPFKPKVVGGLWCVDIYQVAEWFANAQEPGSQDLPIRPPKKAQQNAAMVPIRNKPRGLTGKMAAAIVGARSAQIDAMGRFVFGLQEKDELAFMCDVFEELFFGGVASEQGYTVTIRSLGTSKFKRFAKETTHHFQTEESAADFLVLQLIRVRNADHKQVTHYLLDHRGQRLFHLVVTGKSWKFVSNKLELDLQGL